MSVRFILTVDTEDDVADDVEAYLYDEADRLGARLTRSDYEDHPDYRLAQKRKTIRPFGGK